LTVHLLPSGHLMPDPSQTPFKLAGPPLGLKSTTMVFPSASPTGSRQIFPLPSSGQPGLPSVPLTVPEPSCRTITTRLQLGCFGSEYW